MSPMFNSHEYEVKEVKGLKLVSKLKKTAASTAAAISMAMATGLTVLAEDDNNAAAPNLQTVTGGISTAVKSVIDVISTVAYILVVLMAVIIGLTLIFGGDKAKDKVKSHLVAIIIGTVVVVMAATIAKWWISTISGGTATVDL